MGRLGYCYRWLWLDDYSPHNGLSRKIHRVLFYTWLGRGVSRVLLTESYISI